MSNTTSKCKWSKYLPRNLSGKDMKAKIQSFYRGLSTYAVLLQRMEDNERLWTRNLTLDSEHSGQHKIHEIQNYFVTIGCIIESITGQKPTVDVDKLIESIKLNTDFAYGSSEGNYALKRLEQFLDISQKKLKDKRKKTAQNRKKVKSQHKENPKKERKSRRKTKEIKGALFSV
ncbi:hypothetical protein CHS0354_041157 [Potamilus streckersoni]|uniref:Uncharacterized protein n=1 Tax=Potamilus streckersoni TaxID=2493646 RepID=A0AAE0SF13_9BIVA|nr:hypothetical protein CHS0354_041157 [Potamilus streckersoni]